MLVSRLYRLIARLKQFDKRTKTKSLFCKGEIVSLKSYSVHNIFLYERKKWSYVIKKLFYQIKKLYGPIHSQAASIALIPLTRNDTSCQIYD